MFKFRQDFKRLVWGSTTHTVRWGPANSSFKGSPPAEDTNLTGTRSPITPSDGGKTDAEHLDQLINGLWGRRGGLFRMLYRICNNPTRTVYNITSTQKPSQQSFNLQSSAAVYRDLSCGNSASVGEELWSLFHLLYSSEEK